MKTSYQSLMLFAASVLSACAPTSVNDGASSSNAAAISVASTKSLVEGTWTDSTYSTDGAPFQGITLSADGTYRWTAPCTDPGCLSITTASGRWSIKTGDKANLGALGAYQLELVDTFKQKSAYFVDASGGSLTLSTETTDAGDVSIGQSYVFTTVATQPDGGSSASSCQAASDCSGFLPQDVLTCADGATSAASWACNAGACAVTYCSNDGGSAPASGNSSSDSSLNCAVSQYQACDLPSDCSGTAPTGLEWDCSNQTPLSACNFAEPVCILVSAS